MIIQERQRLFGNEKNVPSIKERLSLYLSHWPLFLISIGISVSVGILYSRYIEPKYIASTVFLVKGGESGEQNSDDLIEAALRGKKLTNLNNELLLLRSFGLMQRTVAKNTLNISYFTKGRVLTLNIYKAAPFRLIPNKITDSTKTYTFYLSKISKAGGVFSTDPESKKENQPFKWNTIFWIGRNSFQLDSIGPVNQDENEYIIQWRPIVTAAAEFASSFYAKQYGNNTSVIELGIKTENLELGKDILNAFFTEYNFSDIESRTTLADITEKFINERLIGITNELKGVEGNLESYQGSKQLVDIKGQSAQSLANSTEVSKTLKDIAIQRSVANMISDYFSSPANTGKLVPSSLGLNDATLGTLITQYNEIQLKKEREAPFVAPNSSVMQDLNTQGKNLRSSILESLNNITQNLQIQEKSFQQQNTQYKTFLSALPHNERVLQEIKRKQSVTEGLYLYLLEKREEAAISHTASNVAHYHQIDPATGFGPVEPNTRNIIMYSAILGFILIFGGLYIKELLNDKIESKNDIISKVSAPIIGNIIHLGRKDKKTFSILGRSILGEQFRAIRMNIMFFSNNQKAKSFLITSAQGAEGKSFVSFNLASVCALPGKKVALVEFDLRKPGISGLLQRENSTGITDYLSGEVECISDIMQSVPEMPSLHVYTSGSYVENPSDLLLSEKVSDLFATLKECYDFIIIDSPPIGLVSDSLVLKDFADSTLFVVRQNFTTKKSIELLNELTLSRKWQNISIVMNGVKEKSERYDYYSNTIQDRKVPVNAGG